MRPGVLMYEQALLDSAGSLGESGGLLVMGVSSELPRKVPPDPKSEIERGYLSEDPRFLFLRNYVMQVQLSDVISQR